MSRYRIGVDIGGTFTDIVVLDEDGAVHSKKVSSSVGDYARAIVDGLAEVFEATGIRGDEILEVMHGTTVASNAILEGKGAHTGLITTRGFRDVLEIRNLRMPRLYDLTWEKPAPLVERYLRREVTERVNAAGEVLVPLAMDEVDAAIDRLLADRVESIAICLLNAYANPVHERLVEARVRERAPGLDVSVSFDVLPEIKEYERTSTTVINAYVMPIVAHYLDRLAAGLEGSGVSAPLLLMQSNGGLTTAGDAARLPCNIIESGPAGGVVGAQSLARSLGLDEVVTLDMGGTTAKAALVERGEVSRSAEYSVGGGIMIGSRLLTGAGYQLRVPAIDLAEVGAGGGSIVWIDAGGSLQIGPQSAGASPGPLCYDQGGTDPTVTDANVILGYLNPEFLVGGALPLNAARSHEVFTATVAEPLGLDLAVAAHGAHRIAAANMIRAIKAVSSERGRDPRTFTLFAFGGNGPLFAATMARAIGMRRVLIPPAPGLFSSFGLLYAELAHHYSRTMRRVVGEAEPGELEAAWAELETRGRRQLADEGYPAGRQALERSASLHYQGQIYELSVSAPNPIDAAGLKTMEEAFGVEHERTYGHRAGPGEPVELVSVQVVAQGLSERPRRPDSIAVDDHGLDSLPPRQAYFGVEHGWLETPVLGRADLAGGVEGPCIIEEYDATCLVPPGARSSLDRFGNIVIDV